LNDKKYTVATRIIADSTSFKSGVRESQSSLRRFVASSKKDIDSLKRSLTSTAGKLASIGLGIGAFKIARETALLDKQMGRIAISARKSAQEAGRLRDEIESLELRTGKDAGLLATAFEEIFALTGSWETARQAISAVNTTISTTTASSTQLAEALATAQTNFGLDMSGKGAAQAFFNKLAGVGAGAGGMGNVATILKNIAPLAQLANMNLDDTIKLISSMSEVTKNPEQIGFYTEQILKTFTNIKAITNKKGGFGKLIFGEKAEQRAPLEVLQGMKELYDGLSGADRIGFLNKITGGSDLRGIKSIQMLLESNALKNIKNIDSINLEKNLPAALNNAVDQASRLKAALEDTAEAFAKPIDRAIANAIKWALDEKELSGGEIIAGGAAAALTAWLGGRYLKGATGKLLAGKGGVAMGVAEGLALSKAGVMPVYVVNFSEMPGAGLGLGPTGKLPGGAKNTPKTAVSLLSKLLKLSPLLLGPAAAYGAASYIEKSTSSSDPYMQKMAGESLDEIIDPSTGRTYLPPGSAQAKKASSMAEAVRNFEYKNLTNVTVFVGGEKQKPTKTIVENRGKF
jgi:hypothetical protein